MLDIDEDPLPDLLEGAVAAGLVSESEEQAGRYRFLHALIQYTLYQDLSATRRQRIHQRVAEALETRGSQNEQVVELAHHYVAATRPSDATKAVRYARLAGDLALAAYAPLDAAAWYSRGLELLARQSRVDESERCTLLIGLGAAQRQAGSPEHRETLREGGRVACRIGDRELLVEVALSRDPGFEAQSAVDPDRLAVLEAALEAVGPADSVQEHGCWRA